jgi:hypothetical protein
MIAHLQQTIILNNYLITTNPKQFLKINPKTAKSKPIEKQKTQALLFQSPQSRTTKLYR